MSVTTEHTPGPWSVRQAKVPTDGEYDHAILDSAGELIAEAFGRVSATETRPSGANAALIARAPEIPELEAQRDELADILSRFYGQACSDGAFQRAREGHGLVHDLQPEIEAALRRAGRLGGGA